MRPAFAHKKAGKDSVALRQKMSEADAAALLAANEDVAREHQVGHVLETDRGLVKAGAERARDLLHQPRRGERFHDLALHLFLADEVKREQRDDFLRRNEAPLL